MNIWGRFPMTISYDHPQFCMAAEYSLQRDKINMPQYTLIYSIPSQRNLEINNSSKKLICKFTCSQFYSNWWIYMNLSEDLQKTTDYSTRMLLKPLPLSFWRPNEENVLWRREREANPTSLSRAFQNLNVRKFII